MISIFANQHQNCSKGALGANMNSFAGEVLAKKTQFIVKVSKNENENEIFKPVFKKLLPEEGPYFAYPNHIQTKIFIGPARSGMN